MWRHLLNNRPPDRIRAVHYFPTCSWRNLLDNRLPDTIRAVHYFPTCSWRHLFGNRLPVTIRAMHYFPTWSWRHERGIFCSNNFAEYTSIYFALMQVNTLCVLIIDPRFHNFLSHHTVNNAYYPTKRIWKCVDYKYI